MADYFAISRYTEKSGGWEAKEIYMLGGKEIYVLEIYMLEVYMLVATSQQASM